VGLGTIPADQLLYKLVDHVPENDSYTTERALISRPRDTGSQSLLWTDGEVKHAIEFSLEETYLQPPFLLLRLDLKIYDLNPRTVPTIPGLTHMLNPATKHEGI
jgi:hypothetical protein